MSDLIRREDVVEALYQAIRTTLTGTFTDSMSLAIAMAKNIPSAEPERKNGKRIFHIDDLISRQAAIALAKDICVPTKDGTIYRHRCIDPGDIAELPSAEPEPITIEEISNQLGCATIQSALYWFEFLKTLDLLGFAIIRKETR